MLSKFDDLLIHQTPYPIERFSTTDPRAFDRLYFNIHDTSGEFVMAVGAGTYPNLDVMDGGVAAVFDNKHWNIRVSRALKGADRADTTIGSLKFEVIEGLKVWKLSLAENEFGVSFDLTFTARTVPFETPHLLIKEGHHYHAYDMTHYTQPGRYEGWLKIGDRKWNVTPETFYGHRDRSWGVRQLANIGRTGRNKADDGFGAGTGRSLHLWMPMQFKDRCIFASYQEDMAGKQSMIMGATHYEDGRTLPLWETVDHDIEFDPETFVHKSSTVTLRREDGEQVTVKTKQLLPGVYIAGMGYDHQGVYQGESHISGEQWDLGNLPEELKKSFPIMADQLAEFRIGDEVGYGIYEHFISPDHPRYGKKQR